MVFICVLFLHVCVLGPTHPVKNGCIKPGPEVIARLIRGSTSCAGPKLFPCERVRQRSFLELWRVWFGVALRDSPAFSFVRDGVRLQLLPVLVFHGYPKGFRQYPRGGSFS